jgi:hypothetical protein
VGKWKADSTDRARCGHPWCTDCATRRGSNIGNRRDRHDSKRELKKEVDR